VDFGGKTWVKTYCTGITMVDRESEPWQKRYDDATFPWCSVLVSFDNSVYKCIPDIVFDFHIVDRGPMQMRQSNSKRFTIGPDSRRYEKLVFDIDEVFRHLNCCRTIIGLPDRPQDAANKPLR